MSVPVRTVLDFPEIGQLAARLEEASLSGRPRLTTWPRLIEFPLSRQQLRMWLLDQLDPGTGVYNLPLALRIDGHSTRRRSPLRCDTCSIGTKACARSTWSPAVCRTS